MTLIGNQAGTIIGPASNSKSGTTKLRRTRARLLVGTAIRKYGLRLNNHGHVARLIAGVPGLPTELSVTGEQVTLALEWATAAVWSRKGARSLEEDTDIAVTKAILRIAIHHYRYVVGVSRQPSAISRIGTALKEATVILRQVLDEATPDIGADEYDDEVSLTVDDDTVRSALRQAVSMLFPH